MPGRILIDLVEAHDVGHVVEALRDAAAKGDRADAISSTDGLHRAHLPQATGPA